MTNRAYSLLEIKSVNDEKRILTGIATTPSTDRQDDIVESSGAEFNLPLPFLFQHNSSSPVGHVTKAKATKTGIEVEVRLQKTDEPGLVKDRLDAAWMDIKLGLVRGLSIGFKPLETAQIDGTWGQRFIKWLWLELSAVTIAANGDCSIQNIKNIDTAQRAASGQKLNGDEVRTPPAPGKKKSTPIVKAQEGKVMSKKTIAEQISAFDGTRKVKSERMSDIMDAAAEKGETLDEAGKTEYDDLAAEVKSIDEHLVRLRAHEATNVVAATVITDVRSSDDGSRARNGVSIVAVRNKNLPVGIGFTRFVIAQARAKGNIMHALEIAKSNEQWKAETPEVEIMLKTAVSEGNTSSTGFGAGLVNYQILTSEFIEYLRPLTIIGRIPGLTRVPFNVKIGRQTGGATVNWVGQGAPKPLTSDTFDNITLDLAKIAGIIVLTDELVRISSPSAELLVRNDLAKAVVQFMDNQFVDPTKSAVTGVSPASITNGVTPVIATGTTGAALRADMRTLLATFLAANSQVSNVVFIMTQQTALSISLMTNSLGNKEFPDINMLGGTLLGIPVVTSENVPSTGGSPTDGYPIILANAPDILLADDGDVTIDASREASLQMDTAPDSPATASTIMVSMFQQNMTAIRAERYVNWAKRRSTAVQYISNAKYFE